MNSELLKIAGAMFLPNVGGLINSTITRKNVNTWYKSLNLPSYCPPDWVFPVAWTGLYTGIGYASYLVWRDGGGLSDKTILPLAAFGTQLALNWSWTPIFFGMHNIKWALFDIMALTPTASVCGMLFYRINKLAGFLFIPYVIWLLYATQLNYDVYKLNPPKDDKPKENKTK